MSTVKDLFDNEELMNVLVDDIEDFPEEAEVTYEVWALGYDTADEPTDVEYLLGEFDDLDDAIACAKFVTVEALTEEFGDPKTAVAYFSIEVETVVENFDDEDGGTVNLGTVFHEKLSYGVCDDTPPDTGDPIIAILADECSLSEDGALKVSCNLLKNFNKNDCLRFQFIDIPDSAILAYKIVSKVEYTDGDYYHCELQL